MTPKKASGTDWFAWSDTCYEVSRIAIATRDISSIRDTDQVVTSRVMLFLSAALMYLAGADTRSSAMYWETMQQELTRHQEIST